MTVDQILYVAARIHDWDKDPMEITKRSMDIVYNAETAAKASEAVDSMAAKGLSVSNIEKADNGLINTATQKLSGIVSVPELTNNNNDNENSIIKIDVSGNVQSVGLGKISASSGALSGAPTANVNIVLTYADAAAAKAKAENFRIYRLDPAKAAWTQVPGQDGKNVDKDNKTVSAFYDGHGIYRIFAVNGFADNLKDVHIYPNPYKGSDGRSVSGDDSSEYRNKVYIENVTNTSKVRIYTISGELVTTLEANDTTYILWDLTNSRGAKVASGIYIVLVTDDDGNKHTGRLTVVR